MHREIDRLEEERLQLKCELRRVARQLGHRAADLGLDTEDLRAVSEFTEALRRKRLGLGLITARVEVGLNVGVDMAALFGGELDIWQQRDAGDVHRRIAEAQVPTFDL